jgi:hypothetical protein
MRHTKKTLVAMSVSFVLSGSKWNDARIYFRHNPDKFDIFTKFQRAVGRTYVMVYQEDVINRLHYGGLTAAMAIFLEEPSAEKDVR